MVEAKYAHLPVLDVGNMNPQLNPTLITDGAGLDKLRSFLPTVNTIGFDYETNVVNTFVNRRIRTVQLGDKNQQFIIDLLAFADGNSDLLERGQGEYALRQQEWSTQPFLRPVIDVLEPVLETNQWLKVGASLQFEYEMSKWNLGLRMWHLYDVAMAERTILLGLVFPNAHDHFGLEDLVAKYMRKGIDKAAQTSFDLKTPLTQEQILYCALDVRLPLGIRAGQLPILVKDDLLNTAELENSAIPAFGDMKLNGLFLNAHKWTANTDAAREAHTKNLKRLDEQFIPVVGRKSDFSDAHLEQLEAEWRLLGAKTEAEKLVKGEERKKLEAERKVKRDAAREKYYAERKRCSDVRKNLDKCEGEALINYGSNPQLLAALHRMKGLNKTNLPSTNDDCLKKLVGKPVIDALRDFRTTEKKISTYGDEFLKYIDPDTGRIHSNITQIGAATGRTSSSNPNMQNIPGEDEVRACFEAQHGRVMLTIDMSGAELRIIADYLQIKSWIDAFNKDWDVHSMGTEILYPEQWPNIGLPDCAYFTKDHKKCKCPQHLKLRNGNKECNFLLAYGGGPDALAGKLNTDRDSASALMDLHKKKNPDVWAGLDTLGRMAKQRGEARSMGGRRRLFVIPNWDSATVAARKELHEEKKEIREPTSREISKKMASMYGSIERQGKNHPIQSTNVDMAKKFMGAGFDKNQLAFLWHVLETKYNALLCSFVHDEVLIECSPDNAEEVKQVVYDCIGRAGADYMKHVKMLAEGHIDKRWKK